MNMDTYLTTGTSSRTGSRRMNINSRNTIMIINKSSYTKDMSSSTYVIILNTSHRFMIDTCLMTRMSSRQIKSITDLRARIFHYIRKIRGIAVEAPHPPR